MTCFVFHFFFYSLQIKPPYIPTIKDDQDVSYFDKEFTEQPAQLTPPGHGSANELLGCGSASDLFCLPGTTL